MHHDEILLLQSIVKSAKVNFDPDDSWLLGQLAILMFRQIEVSSFADTTLQIVRSHPHFQNTVRVSLVKRLGLANQLVVLSVAHMGSKPNTMAPGYSCFVNAEGSLFQLKPSEVRTYASAAQVVQSFQDKGLPPQRSIGRIHRLGLESGLCLPLFHGKHMSGLAFFNNESGQGQALKLHDSDYAIMSYLQSASSLFLLNANPVSTEYYSLATRGRDSYVADVLDEHNLAAVLDEHSKILGRKISYAIKINSKPSLCSLGNIANLLSRLAYTYSIKHKAIHIEEDKDRLVWEVVCDSNSSISKDYVPAASIWSDFNALHLPVVVREAALKFSMDYDAVDPSSRVRYSV